MNGRTFAWARSTTPFPTSCIEKIMPYNTDWALLSEVLRRLVDAGGREGEVKADICGVIADRKVSVRAVAEIGLETPFWEDQEIEIPPNLRPDDIDWVTSRPRMPFRVGLGGVVPGTRRYASVELAIRRF